MLWAPKYWNVVLHVWNKFCFGQCRKIRHLPCGSCVARSPCRWSTWWWTRTGTRPVGRQTQRDVLSGRGSGAALGASRTAARAGAWPAYAWHVNSRCRPRRGVTHRPCSRARRCACRSRRTWCQAVTTMISEYDIQCTINISSLIQKCCFLVAATCAYLKKSKETLGWTMVR